MPTNRFIFPARQSGFARSACLAPFASGVATASGAGFLSLGDYELGNAYYFVGQSIIPITIDSGGNAPVPALFGDWVFAILGGILPTLQPSGGIIFVDGASGAVNWTNLAFTGTEALKVETNLGGVLGYDSALPDLNYVITGSEIFTLNYQILDVVPAQIELQVYEKNTGWYPVYIGTDQFGLGGFHAGPVPSALNTWLQLNFTPAQLGLSPGMIITGLSWGVYNSTGISTVVFSDVDVALPNLLFGSWVYTILGGQLPTAQSTGGIEFVGGSYGSVSWSSLAFTGNHGLEVQTHFGGVLGFDSVIPNLNHVVTGTELFALEYQVLDTIPEQLEFQVYEASLGWHTIYWGTDKFGLGGFHAGPVSPTTNDWVRVTFTPANLGLTTGTTITGLSWGVYNSTGVSTVVFSDVVDLNSTVNPMPLLKGYIDTCQDGQSGFYILSHNGPLIKVPSIASDPIIINLLNNPSFDYTGLTFNRTDNTPYFIGYDASIYKWTGSSVVTVTPPPSGVSVPARLLFNDGANLYTLFANSNKIGKYNIAGNIWNFISTPFTVSTDTIHYSGVLATLLAGGTNYPSLTNSNTIRGIAFSTASNQLLTTDSFNEINIYNPLGNDFIRWVSPPSQQIAGTGTPSVIATEPDGGQALVLDTTNNIIQVLTNIGGVWSATSTVPIASPTAIAIFDNNSILLTQAFVCETSQNRVSVLNKTLLTWQVVQSISIPSPTSVAVTLSSNNVYRAIVTTSTGVTHLEFNGAVWVQQGSDILNPVPTLSASDFVNAKNSHLYAVGTSGGNSEVYTFQDGVPTSGYAVSGIVSSFGVVNFQIVSALSSGSIDVGAVVENMVSHGLISGAVAPTNSSLMAWIVADVGFPPNLLIANSNNIWSFYNDQSQSVLRAPDAQLATFNGTSWNVLDLNESDHVSSITVDPSGNVFAMLTDNVLYKYQSGVLAPNYPYTLTPPPNQEFSVPLGFSKMVYWNGALIAASSLMGGITVITP